MEEEEERMPVGSSVAVSGGPVCVCVCMCIIYGLKRTRYLNCM